MCISYVISGSHILDVYKKQMNNIYNEINIMNEVLNKKGLLPKYISKKNYFEYLYFIYINNILFLIFIFILLDPLVDNQTIKDSINKAEEKYIQKLTEKKIYIYIYIFLYINIHFYKNDYYCT